MNKVVKALDPDNNTLHIHWESEVLYRKELIDGLELHKASDDGRIIGLLVKIDQFAISKKLESKIVVNRVCDKISKEELFQKFTEGQYTNYCNTEEKVKEKIPKEDYDIKFDWENFEFNTTNQIPMSGPQELEGRSFIGCYAGGDWEYPIFFIVYLQDGEWRAYLPKDGNVYNKDTNQVFGNGYTGSKSPDVDFTFLKRVFPEEMKDVTCSEDYEFDNQDCELMLDWDKIKADIISNIKVKD